MAGTHTGANSTKQEAAKAQRGRAPSRAGTSSASRTALARIGAICAAKARPAITVLAHVVLAGTCLAQTPAPVPGHVLKDLERSLPTKTITSPEGLQIEIPDAPALNADAAGKRITVRGFRISGNTVFDENTLLALVAGRTGEMSIAELRAVAEELTLYYRSRGYFLARAYLPQQEIERGVVTIAVLEGRYDRITLQNTARIGDQRAARTLQHTLCDAGENCEGALIARSPLERGLLLLNDLPGVQAAARLSPGATTGTSTLSVEASAGSLVSGSAQLDNGGSYYSGAARALGALWIDSPFGFGDQITAQGGATGDHGHLYYGALGYGVPLGHGGTRLSVRGSYLNYDLGDRYASLGAHGKVGSADVSLTHPFVRSRSANLSGSAAYGGRRFHDLLDAAGVNTRRRIRDRGEASLNADLRDELFAAPALNTLSVLYTTGRLRLDDQLVAFDAATARSAGRYGKWGAAYTRLQSLTGRTSLYVRAVAQLTSDNLDSYEKFALGGPDSVRAYPPGDTLADEALLGSVELRHRFEWGDAARALEASVFFDHARGRLNAAPWESGVHNRATLSGVGIGIGCALMERLTLSSTLAFRGDREMTAAPDRRYHFALSMRAAF